LFDAAGGESWDEFARVTGELISGGLLRVSR
jgi:hypothetical protein